MSKHEYPIPDGWKKFSLRDIGKSFIGLTYSPENIVEEGGTLVLRSSNVFGNRVAYGDNVYVDMTVPERMITKPGDLLICVRNGSRSLIGKNALIDESSAGHAFGAFMAVYRSEMNSYLVHLFQTDAFQRQIQQNLGATINQITNANLESFEFILPPLSEQRKIAEILGTWDEAIRLTADLIAAKQQRKKGLMQRLLSGEVRFPGFAHSGSKQSAKYFQIPTDWSLVKIGDIAHQVTRKNSDDHQLPVLSCTKHDGLVDSLEYFGRQIFSDDISTYKVVSRGQFAYATNHIEEGSIGYQDKYDEAVISPMYTVFEANRQVDDRYLYRVLKTETYRKIFAINTNASVNRRGSLRWNEFSQIQVPLPSLKEQEKIADFFQACDHEIDLLQQKHAALQQQKKGLMQRLLTGQVRVRG